MCADAIAVLEQHIRRNAANAIGCTWLRCRWNPAFRVCHRVQLANLYDVVGEHHKYPGVADRLLQLRS